MFRASTSLDTSGRGGFDNITSPANPYVVNGGIDSQFRTFSAFQGRSFTSRIQLLGRK